MIQKAVIQVAVLMIIMLMPFRSQAQEPDDDFLQVGGALRFNYNLSSWKEGQMKRGGDLGYDLFRLNVLGSYNGIRLNAEYRWYSEGFGGGMLKQGFIALDAGSRSELQIGLNQVPFGIQQYNSHNWFFNLTYYLGFEDDHDMGIKYIYDHAQWQWQAAWYLSAEELVFDEVEASPRRYSYDVTGRNKENNQLNLKGLYRFGSDNRWQAGASLQGGLLYNLDTQHNGNHYAMAVHAERLPMESPLGLKAQYMHYGFNPEAQQGQADNFIMMGAYGANYRVASAGHLFSLAASWQLDVSMPYLQGITFYNDFGYLYKPEAGFEDTYMNVTGMLLDAGKVFVYVDLAMGYNHPWLGPEWTRSLAYGTPGGAGWHRRFNINLGYYF
ncbi:MAG: hypothetical protein R6U64_07620 [Bacteroidales bacterium]